MAVQTDPPAMMHEVLAELRARLRLHDLTASEVSGCLVPLATVRLRLAQDQAHVGIDITDAVTVKRVGRDVDLRAVSDAERPHLLAIATEELLRASWLEVRVAAETPAAAVKRPKSPVPVQVRDLLEEALSPSSSPRFATGLEFAGELWSGGSRELGGSIWAEPALGKTAGLRVALGARAILARDSDLGSASGHSWGGEAMATMRFPWPKSLGTLSAAGGVRLWRVAMRGDAMASDVQEHRVRLTAIDACLVARLSSRVNPMVRVALQGCRSVQGVAATGNGSAILAHEGWMFGGSLGGGWSF